ncbi:hypothetical protein GCM10022231_16790 [Gordonia caeni]|uniref:AB hydrolase-1 domain-containing protein n=2 Tax=Gordonia caeni TaxID=1007097 RepID=A0ABP7P1C2_9ACTN
MGAWIWEPTVERLIDRGMDADTITLRGLRAGDSPADVASVRLDDHVEQLIEHVENQGPRPVVLVSHSYSGMVTASVADRLADRQLGLVHIGAFLPTSGRSLLDDWGDSEHDRTQERDDIDAAGGLWAAPTRAMLDHQTDLSPADRDYLAAKLTAHPGRTVTDPAQLSGPVETQTATYVALTRDGGHDEAWRDAPPIARSASGWRRRHLVAGHWPMLSAVDATVDLLEAEIGVHARLLLDRSDGS